MPGSAAPPLHRMAATTRMAAITASDREAVTCPLCGPGDVRRVATGRDYRFGHPETYTFVSCVRCGLVFLNPRPTGAAIGALYKRYYTPHGSLAREALRTGADGALARLWRSLTGSCTPHALARARGRVLDVGCGTGELLLHLRAAGHDVRGVESNPRYQTLHHELGLPVFCGSLGDARFPGVAFDTVILSQVIEHVGDPVGTLREIRRLLVPRGRVLIYCPNAAGYLRRWFGPYWHGWHVPFHFWVFDRRTIAELARRAGLTVAALTGVTPNDFFVTSLKSYLYRDDRYGSAVERGGLLDTRVARLVMVPVFRALDALLPGREDCLIAELVREGP